MTQIFDIGSLKRKQAARREDGEWFVRDKLRSPWGMKWSGWRPVGKKRPEHAWYNPAAGEARLPAAERTQTTMAEPCGVCGLLDANDCQRCSVKRAS